MTTIPSSAASRPYLGLAALGLGAALPSMDIAVNVAFPAITAAFDLDTRGIRWVVVYYVVTYACLMLAFGRLGDAIGHRRIFRAGLLTAVAGYVGCAVAQEYSQLLLARIVQGVSTALLLSCAPALATRLFHEARRTHALAMYTATTALAATIAPLIGGASIALLDWSGVFWMRVPLIVLALLMVERIPPDGHAVRPAERTAPFLLAAAIASLLLAPSVPNGTQSIETSIAFLAVGLALLAAFRHYQRRTSSSYFAHLLTSRSDFVLHNLANAVNQFGAFAVPLVVPYYLARVAGFGPEGIGAALALSPVGMLLGSSIAAHAVRRFGTRPAALAGLACAVAGTFAIALWSLAPSQAHVLLALLLNGTGIGLFQVVYADIVVASLPRHARGVAGSLTMVTRTVGVVLAASALTAAVALMERTHIAAGVAAQVAFATAFTTLFSVVALLPACVFAVAMMRRSLFREPR